MGLDSLCKSHKSQITNHKSHPSHCHSTFRPVQQDFYVQKIPRLLLLLLVLENQLILHSIPICTLHFHPSSNLSTHKREQGSQAWFYAYSFLSSLSSVSASSNWLLSSSVLISSTQSAHLAGYHSSSSILESRYSSVLLKSLLLFFFFSF